MNQLARNLLFLLIFLLGTGWQQAAFSQSNIAGRPEAKVGDRWKVERRDPFSKALELSEETQVTNVSAEKIDVTVNGEPGILTPEMNVLEGARFRYDVGYLLLHFPMEVGKEWKFKTNWTNKQTGSNGFASFDVKVLGYERIKVALGEFDSYKLEAIGQAANGYPARHIYWYAPKAKGIIRSEVRVKNDQYLSEIVEFSLAP